MINIVILIYEMLKLFQQTFGQISVFNEPCDFSNF